MARRTIEMNCAVCGDVFDASPWHVKHRGMRYCSKSCLATAIHAKRHRPVEVRLWAGVEIGFDREGCWEWQKSKTVDGYGTIGFGGKTVRAHRLVWELTVGPIPVGLQVLHSCDNPSCCRPTHLFLGTQVDNIKDMCRKGRNVPPPVVRKYRENLHLD